MPEHGIFPRSEKITTHNNFQNSERNSPFPETRMIVSKINVKFEIQLFDNRFQLLNATGSEMHAVQLSTFLNQGKIVVGSRRNIPQNRVK